MDKKWHGRKNYIQTNKTKSNYRNYLNNAYILKQKEKKDS